jgi:hypothetical protein
MKKVYFIAFFASLFISAKAQIGEYRSELSVGVNGGYVLSNVGFTPEVPQNYLGGLTGGLTLRYTCEKYFKSICALVGEINVTQAGWKERIQDASDLQIINPVTGVAEEYQRQLTYIQVPMMARMGWGRERSGFQFFFQLGPQVGFFLNDKVTTNFDYKDRNLASRVGVMKTAAQDTLSIQRKFDYGIAGGVGLEYSHPKIGHFMLEGRYYYGLGDIFNNSKSDFFGRSNLGNIVIKLTYLYDIKKTNNNKIK